MELKAGTPSFVYAVAFHTITIRFLVFLKGKSYNFTTRCLEAYIVWLPSCQDFEIMARILIHQPWLSGLGGQATDIDLAAKEILRMRERINEILVHHTGQDAQRIQTDTERDYIMSAEQGKNYGIIDDVIRKRV